MSRPDVVMSDAADLVEVHTLRVVKPSDSHSRTCMLVGLNDSVELHRRVPTSAATACPTPCQLRRWDDEACSGDMTSSSWLIRMQLGSPDDSSVLDSDEYPTAGLGHPPSSRRVLTVSAGQQYASPGATICQKSDQLRTPTGSGPGYELSLSRPPTTTGPCVGRRRHACHPEAVT
jgi:hypothetical protein